MSQDIVARFIADTQEEDPKLAQTLAALDEGGQKELGGVLGRFDAGGNGTLGSSERLYARRVLNRLRRPDAEVLTAANKVLDYLDLNADAKLDKAELDLAVEVLDMFAKVDDGNDTLSVHELELLFAVLRHIDADDSRQLEKAERAKLRSSLQDPEAFWAQQKEQNPLVQELLAQR